MTKPNLKVVKDDNIKIKQTEVNAKLETINAVLKKLSDWIEENFISDEKEYEVHANYSGTLTAKSLEDAEDKSQMMDSLEGDCNYEVVNVTRTKPRLAYHDILQDELKHAKCSFETGANKFDDEAVDNSIKKLDNTLSKIASHLVELRKENV